MSEFDIYYENADTDEPRRWVMIIKAMSLADALQLASEYLEIPSYDLVAKRREGRGHEQETKRTRGI